MTPLQLVQEQIDKYQHPFFDFSARKHGEDIDLLIRSRIPDVLSPEYRFTFSETELNSPQFPWTFQRILYDCLTDYVVELFTKCP